MRKAYLIPLLFIALFAVSSLTGFSGKKQVRYYNTENVYHPDELSNNDYLANFSLNHIKLSPSDTSLIILCRNNSETSQAVENRKPFWLFIYVKLNNNISW